MVDALHSERRIVADTAAELLEHDVNAWQLRSRAASSPAIAQLGAALASHVTDPGPHAAAASARLATRILLWPIDRNVVDGEQIVAHCETILRAFARPAAAELLASEAASDREPVAPANKPTRPADTNAMVAAPMSSSITDLAEALELPPQPVPRTVTTPIEPAPFQPPPTSNGITAPRANESRSGVHSGDDQPDARSLTPQDQGVREQAVLTPAVLATLPDINVMRRLVSDQPAEADAAAKELVRRGYKPIHLQLARVLVDDDVPARVRLVEMLPQLTSVDSRPWLVWLSGDESPEVRRAAIALIATSNDPALRDHLREIEQDETDTEILRLVRRVLSSPLVP